MNNTLYKMFHPNLIEDNIFSSIITFSLPLMVSLLFLQTYNMVDTIIVGHYLGENALGAIGASLAIYELLIGFGNGFGNGLGIVVARAYGAKNTIMLKKAVAGSIILTCFVTFAIMICGHFCLKPLLNILNTPPEIIDDAFDYIWIVSIFSGVLFAYNLFGGLLRAIGNSVMPLIFLIISSILNIFLDILLITKFNMGVKGTAIATVISQAISSVLCLIYILIYKPILIPQKNHFKIDWLLYKDLNGQGLSMAMMNSLVCSGSIILQLSINSFGSLILAGHICARKIFAITIIPMIALGISSATYVSQNYGAYKFDRIKQGVRYSNILCLIWGLLCTIIIPITAKFLISQVSGSDNEQVITYGTKYISFMQPFYAVLGVLFVTRNSLQGLNCKILPLISSIIELLGKILFTFLIIPFMGIWGIILCEPLIWVAMTVQLILSYRRIIKNKATKNYT